MPQLPFTFRDHVRAAPKADGGREAPEEEAPPAEPRPADEGPTIFSVSQLQRRLRTQLERHYAEVWVAGELSNFSMKRVPSGSSRYAPSPRSASVIRNDLAWG